MAGAVLPVSFFPEPPKPGDTITLRVDQVMEDEVLVSPATAEEPEGAAMEASEAELEGMAGPMPMME